MDAIVNAIISKPKDLDSLRKYLDQHLPVIRTNLHQISGAIQALDPSRHSVGICYLLYAKSLAPTDHTFPSLCEWFFDLYIAAQIREHCADKFAAVIAKYADHLRRSKVPQRGMAPLQRVMQSLAPSPDSITPAHAEFVCLCLLAKNYKFARPTLECTIFDVNPKATGITPRSLLQYYYYGAMVWIGLKLWDKAYDFLMTALTVPSAALSAIMVESFKKFVLVSLIAKGKMDNVPKQCSTAAQRNLKKYCSEYMDLAQVFSKREVHKVRDLIAKHRDVFQQDHNLGLVSQVQDAYLHQSIQRLTSTYLTLSLSDIALNVGLPNAKEAERTLIRMIADGQLRAVISQKDGMVSFTDDSLATGAEAEHNLELEIQAAQKIVSRLEAIDRDLESSKDFISKQLLRDPRLREEMDLEPRAGAGKSRFHRMVEGFKIL